MPQPPIPEYWRERVKSRLAEIEQRGEKPSDKWIWEVLQKEAAYLREDGSAEDQVLANRVPSQRTISRIRKEEFPQLSKEGRARYRIFYWPESMERGDLPWEASAAALELLHEIDKLSNKALQPSVKAVRFFWHVNQAAHDAPFWLRMGAAMLLMKAARDHDWGLERAVQWLLAYRPWHRNDRDQYKKALERSSNPIPAIPKDSMPLLRITEPVLNNSEFLKLVRERKLEWLDTFGSETLELSPEEQNG